MSNKEAGLDLQAAVQKKTEKPVKKRFLNLRRQRIIEGYGFVSLWLIGFFLFMFVPLGQSLYYAFNDIKVGSQGLEFNYIGFANFRRAFTIDVDFMPIFMSTLRNVVYQVPLILVFSMLAALLLNKAMFGRTAFRAIFFLPTIVATGPVLIKLTSSSDDQNLAIFEAANMRMWLTQFIPPRLAEPLLQMMDQITLVMWDSGVQILIFLAGLQSISSTLYEAAKIDGATPWEMFWKVTFPLMMPITLVNTLYSIVNTFTGVKNQMLGYINLTAFSKSGLFGYAAAMGWIYFVMIFIILGFVFFLFRNSAKHTERR